MVVLIRGRGRVVIKLHKIATEQRNERSKNIDKVSTLEMLTIINEEDKKVSEVIAKILPQIAVAVDCIADRLAQGGRLFYIGAGTSGRLGILDAAECPPTFSTEPERVQGIIAGGYKAIFNAQEGAEDSEKMARIDLKEKKINNTDAVVGLTASGRTPYVLGGLKYALECGAATIAITCTNNAETTPWAQIPLTAVVGPEVITGSTRMKAGTAQKLILNMLSTGAMIKLGKVYGNLMIDVKATNKKLEERARSIVMTATNCDRKVADEALEKAQGSARVAVSMILSGLEAEEAKKHLATMKI
jgi:N-acetylmuramic acid 6-phosphate etherase